MSEFHSSFFGGFSRNKWREQKNHWHAVRWESCPIAHRTPQVTSINFPVIHNEIRISSWKRTTDGEKKKHRPKWKSWNNFGLNNKMHGGMIGRGAREVVRRLQTPWVIKKQWENRSTQAVVDNGSWGYGKAWYLIQLVFTKAQAVPSCQHPHLIKFNYESEIYGPLSHMLQPSSSHNYTP